MPLLQGTAKSKISSVSIGVALTCCLCQRLFSNVLNKLVVGRKSCLSQETVIETRIVWDIWSRQSALNTDRSKTRRTRCSQASKENTHLVLDIDYYGGGDDRERVVPGVAASFPYFIE